MNKALDVLSNSVFDESYINEVGKARARRDNSLSHSCYCLQNGLFVGCGKRCIVDVSVSCQICILIKSDSFGVPVKVQKWFKR